MKACNKYLLPPFVGAGLLVVTSQGFAATLGLGSGIPDLTTANASVDYTYTAMCFDTQTGTESGACGTDNGAKGPSKRTYDGSIDLASSGGVLTVSGNTMTLLDSVGTNFVIGGSYSLTAYFDGYGDFLSPGSTVSADYSSIMTGSGGATSYASGLLVNGDLTLSGLSGIGDAGTLEFAFDITSGDFASFGTDGGITISMFSGAGWDAGLDWDLANSLGESFWQHSFSATANVDTFVMSPVPVPGAIWLFGSGILALAGLVRRKHNITQ